MKYFTVVLTCIPEISDWASFHGPSGYLGVSGDKSTDLCLFEWGSVGLHSVTVGDLHQQGKVKHV